MAMTIYTILDSKGQARWSATMDSVAGAAWVSDCENKNLWGLPQRTISPNLQGELIDWDGSVLNSANASSLVTITDVPEIPAVAASFSGIPAGCATSITLVANTAGTAGNISLTCDGKSTLSSLAAAWNTLNSSSQLTLTGDGTQIPSSGSISLLGGVNAIPPVTHTGYVFAAQYTVQTALATEAQDPNWIAFRAKRDQLLKLCDWLMLSDSPYASDQAAWSTYRAALRNLPTNTTDPTNPTWPTPPSSPSILGINS
jgi:Phage tail assembly chaperone protein